LPARLIRVHAATICEVCEAPRAHGGRVPLQRLGVAAKVTFNRAGSILRRLKREEEPLPRERIMGERRVPDGKPPVTGAPLERGGCGADRPDNARKIADPRAS
jgi:hypothetical protein